MKKYQVIERFYGESKIVATLNSRTMAEMTARLLQEEYQKNGLEHFFEVKEIIVK